MVLTAVERLHFQSNNLYMLVGCSLHTKHIGIAGDTSSNFAYKITPQKHLADLAWVQDHSIDPNELHKVNTRHHPN